MEEAVNDGRFREDLYYRLNVLNITVPPLRERKEEIPFFFDYFLKIFSEKYHKKVKPLNGSVMKAFLQYSWPGNVRELENLIQRYVILENEEEICLELSQMNHFLVEEEKEGDSNNKDQLSLKNIRREAVQRAEKEIIHKVLQQTNWNRKKAAQLLGINYQSLLYKIKTSGVCQ